MIIDATDAIVGRLAAYAAKMLLRGEDVHIVNVERAVFSCTTPRTIIERYTAKRALRSLASPEKKSPSKSWSRRPDYLFRRILRGMLPKHSPRTANALKRFRAWTGVPAELEEKLKATPAIKPIKTAAQLGLGARTITLLEVCQALGWKTHQ